MSTRRQYVIETVQVIEVTSITKQEIEEIKSNLIDMIVEAFKRLSSHLTACRISYVDNVLVLHDELGVVPELEQILESYGMRYTKLNDNTFIKGHTYLATNDLLSFYEMIKGDFTQVNKTLDNLFGVDHELAKKLINSQDINKLKLKNPYQQLDSNPLFHDILEAAIKNERLKIDQVNQKRITTYDGRVINEEVVSSQSNYDQYQMLQNEFNEKLMKINISHKKNIVEGTTKSLEIRAKKMGYHVSRTTNNDQVQLILVRER
ncbi:MAG TPA: hypothetical protein PLR26_04660 [Bacilli bacterium]|nr:hypothetical protein [Bacilli bacterium]